MDAVFKELKRKHNDEYETPKLRLWARMISSKLHDDYESSPNIPAFQGSVIKKSRQQSNLSNALSGAAVAFANALHGNTSSTEKASNTDTPSMSPGKAVSS